MDAKSFLLGSEQWSFIPEVLLRTTISFVVVLIALRLTGKRGVRQLTLFELVIILTLGSAAGDISFYSDVGVIPVIAAIAMIIALYRLVTFIVQKSETIEHVIEGNPVMIIENGRLNEEYWDKENISSDEFYMELRLKNVEHLGQVKYAFLEVNGDVSVFKFPADETRPGLSILPQNVCNKFETNPKSGLYSCIKCGHTEEADLSAGKQCAKCKNNIWSAGER